MIEKRFSDNFFQKGTVKIKINMEQYLNNNLRAKVKVTHSLSTIRRNTGTAEV